MGGGEFYLTSRQLEESIGIKGQYFSYKPYSSVGMNIENIPFGNKTLIEILSDSKIFFNNISANFTYYKTPDDFFSCI